MNLGKSLVQVATAPVRVGLAAADAGLGIASGTLHTVQQAYAPSRRRCAPRTGTGAGRSARSPVAARRVGRPGEPGWRTAGQADRRGWRGGGGGGPGRGKGP